MYLYMPFSLLFDGEEKEKRDVIMYLLVNPIFLMYVPSFSYCRVITKMAAEKIRSRTTSLRHNLFLCSKHIDELCINVYTNSKITIQG